MKTTSLLALMTILFANAAFAQDGSHGGETIYGTEFYSLAMQFDELTNGQYKMIQSLTVPTSIAIKPKAGPIYLEDLPSGGSKTKVDAKTNKSLRETELDTTEWVKKSCFQKVWLAVHETFIYGGQETSLSYDYSGAVVMKYKKQLLPPLLKCKPERNQLRTSQASHWNIVCRYYES